MIRYSVRIKLTDFIDTMFEEQILATVHSIGEESGKKVYLKLWYLPIELSQERVLAFVKKYEKLLEEVGTNIHAGDHETWTQKSWFNIRKSGETTPTEYRHEYMYNNAYGILEALSVFRITLLKMEGIGTAPQPQQKRENGSTPNNGYRVTIKRIPNVQ